MTAKELELCQEEIQAKVENLAKKINCEAAPIYDGVADIEAYLKSSPRVMWLLKEPYDEFKSDGTPCGGGWSFTDNDAWNENSWNNSSFRTIIITMYNYLHKLNYVNREDIDNDAEYWNVLKQIAFVNFNKLPAQKRSRVLPDVFRDIVLEQIHCYNPQVVICGNTFWQFAWDLFGGKPEYTKSYWYHDIYKKGATLFVDAYHPAQWRYSQKEYIDNLVEILNDYTNLIK